MSSNRYTESEAELKDVDDSIDIIQLFDGKDFRFDCVKAEMNGDSHPVIINHESDRAYYILEGNGTVKVGDEEIEARSRDLITVTQGKKHTISGTLKYLVITSPPFDPENEEVVDE